MLRPLTPNRPHLYIEKKLRVQQGDKSPHYLERGHKESKTDIIRERKSNTTGEG